MQCFLPAFCYFLYPRSKYYPQHSILSDLRNDVRNCSNYTCILSNSSSSSSIGAATQRGLLPPHFSAFYIPHNDAPQSVRLLWTSDQPVAETSTWQHATFTRETSKRPAGFEPAISVGEKPQTYVLGRAATVTGRRTERCNTK